MVFVDRGVAEMTVSNSMTMSSFGQTRSVEMEMIGPEGEITFIPLNAGKGILNIGRHADNDVVIDAPEVADFHAMLDYRRAPYQLINFSENGLTLNGMPVPQHNPQEVQRWDTLALAGYTLLWLDSSGSSNIPTTGFSPSSLGTDMMSGIAQMPATSAASAGSDAPITSSPTRGVFVPDRFDETIVVDLLERSATVDVNQSATYTLTVVNGGPLVAGFEVKVDGLDPTWITVTPARFNLTEGARATAIVSISAPRTPNSRAGQHPFSITVSSPDYRNHLATRSATFILNPYYEFDMTELEPRQQTVGWRKSKRTAHAVLQVSNHSNAEFAIKLEAGDDERACQVEFQTAGGRTRRARQIELRAQPDETLPLDVFITPNKRDLISMRGKSYQIQFTATVMASMLMQQTATGQINSKPLIGPGLVFVMALILAGIIVLVFRPQLNEFNADKDLVIPGETLTLSWNASAFTNVRIDPEPGDQAKSTGVYAFQPVETKTYRLSGENLLSRLLPFLAPTARERLIAVKPIKPTVNRFDAITRNALIGDSVTIFWEVNNASELTLVTNGAPETLPPEQLSKGQRKVTLDGDARYELRAKNRYGEVTQNFSIKVSEPTPTPIPPPQIVRFDVKPASIIAGEEVLIEWEVLGADRVTLSPLIGGADGYPPKGSIAQKPDRSVAYVLTAFNGNVQSSRQQNIIVAPAPTATPLPFAPKIVLFKVLPNSLVLQGTQPGSVVLSWQVQGEFTNIEISNPDIGKINNQPAVGSLTLSVKESTFFLLTATNKDQVSSQTVEIVALPATPTPTTPPTGTPPPPPPTGTPVPPTPTLTPTPTPTPTSTPYPPPSIQFFSIASGANPIVPDEVTQILDPSVPANTLKYSVLAGAKVKFTWQASGAENVQLDGAPVPNPGDTVQLGRENKTYRLVAINPGGQVERFIVVELRERPAPPAPTGFTGEYKVNSNQLTWQYPQASQDSIVGFRIYRASTGSDFTRIADETQSGKAERAFNDPSADPACGQSYYIVAVYLDLFGQAAETPPSATSWYSQKCS